MIHMCFIMFIVTWFILWTNLIDNIRDVWKITWKYYSLLPQEGTSKKSWIFKIAQGWHHHTHLGLFTGTLYNNNQKRKKLLQTFWGWRILVSYSAGLLILRICFLFLLFSNCRKCRKLRFKIHSYYQRPCTCFWYLLIFIFPNNPLDEIVKRERSRLRGRRTILPNFMHGPYCSSFTFYSSFVPNGIFYLIVVMENKPLSMYSRM